MLRTCGILAVGAGPGPAGTAAPPLRQAVQVEDGARGEDQLAGPAAHPARPQDGGRLGRPRPAGQTDRQRGGPGTRLTLAASPHIIASAL